MPPEDGISEIYRTWGQNAKAQARSYLTAEGKLREARRNYLTADKEATKIAQTRFVALLGAGAALRSDALIQFMLETRRLRRSYGSDTATAG
jgi:seryl-tRNA synthetase